MVNQMVSDTFLFSHFSLLSTSRFICSHFFLALVTKHMTYFNYFLFQHSSVYQHFVWLWPLLTINLKAKQKLSLLFLFINFQNTIQLISHLSEACCVLNLDGGMERKAKNTMYNTAPWAPRINGMDVPSNGDRCLQSRQLSPYQKGHVTSRKGCQWQWHLYIPSTPFLDSHRHIFLS